MADPINYLTDQIHDGPSCKFCGAVMVEGKCLSCGGSVADPEQALRQEFEKWASGFDRVFPLEKDASGDYLSVLTGNVWVIVRRSFDLGAQRKETEHVVYDKNGVTLLNPPLTEPEKQRAQTLKAQRKETAMIRFALGREAYTSCNALEAETFRKAIAIIDRLAPPAAKEGQ